MLKKYSYTTVSLLAVITLSITIFGQNSGKRVFPDANKTEFIGEHKLYYGAAYYPEVWPVADMDKDIARMKELKMNVMRMTEFSWSKMEPTEGNFDFTWLHTIVDKLHKNGIDVILGTPTATPPVWLAEKHPEIFQVNEQGIRMTQIGRAHV